MSIIDIRTLATAPVSEIMFSDYLSLQDIHHSSSIDIIERDTDTCIGLSIKDIDNLILALQKVKELRK